MNRNSARLIGHLGKDPEVKVFEGGGKIANVTIATDDSYTNKEGQKVPVTDWHNVVFRNKSAELAEKYLRKGMFVIIEGKIKNRSWDGADGQKHYITEIQADGFIMAPNGSGNNQASGQDNQQPAGQLTPEKDTDDLPF